MIRVRGVLVLASLLPSPMAAQAGDAFSIVGAVVGIEQRGRDVAGSATGLGYEAQVRFAASGSRSSIGLGAYATTNSSPGVTLSGTFLELRVAFPKDSSDGINPYVATRLSHFRRGSWPFGTPGTALGAGAGAVLPVGPRVQLDGSGTFAFDWFPATGNAIKSRGASVTLRLGAAVQLGT